MYVFQHDFCVTIIISHTHTECVWGLCVQSVSCVQCYICVCIAHYLSPLQFSLTFMHLAKTTSLFFNMFFLHCTLSLLTVQCATFVSSNSSYNFIKMFIFKHWRHGALRHAAYIYLHSIYKTWKLYLYKSWYNVAHSYLHKYIWQQGICMFHDMDYHTTCLMTSLHTSWLRHIFSW